MENIYRKEIKKQTFYLKMELGIKKKKFNVTIEEIVRITKWYTESLKFIVISKLSLELKNN